MKRTVKTIAVWLFAIAISFGFVNLFIFIYFHQPGWISRSEAATNAIWNPGSSYSNALEGFGAGKIDENGYINQYPLAEDNYILVMGSSHTQGKEVPIDERYTELVNRKITAEQKEYIYNIGTDGHYLPDLLKHFSAAVKEFPRAKGVVLEVFQSDCDSNTLESCLKQVPYNPEQDGSVIADKISRIQKLAMTVKENMPLLNLLQQKQFADFKIDFSGAFGIGKQNLQEQEIDEQDAQELDVREQGIEGQDVQESDVREQEIEEQDVQDLPGGESGMERYQELLDQVFTTMKKEYQGKIFILYHPIVKISGDQLEITYDDSYRYFQQVCKNQDIQIIDTGVAFQDCYDKQYGVPYGFGNTSMGEGHLNRTGHRILADELYDALCNANLISCEDN